MKENGGMDVTLYSFHSPSLKLPNKIKTPKQGNERNIPKLFIYLVPKER